MRILIDDESLSQSPAIHQPQFRVRAVTAFVNLQPCDFALDSSELLESTQLKCQIDKCVSVTRAVEKALVLAGYEVQTVRIATNPFGEWLYDGTYELPAATDIVDSRLRQLDSLLAESNIQFCCLGPAESEEEVTFICPKIIEASSRFSCSANVEAADVDRAKAAAKCVIAISQLGEKDDALTYLAGGLGNFRFCAASSCKPFIPFVPGAKSARSDEMGSGFVGFALGLENGALAKCLLQESGCVSRIHAVFRNGMASELAPLQEICEKVSTRFQCQYIGVDSSLNPSLDPGGSVAEAIESLADVRGNFGGVGTLAAVAAITTSLQSLPGIKLTGYCGLMLPVCEDTRLSFLASVDDPGSRLTISNILTLSSVCGVGVDTVPVPGDCSEDSLASLILDVAGLAGRWNKSLSCRVFPVPGIGENAMTTFESPYLCNCRTFGLS